MTLLIPDVNVLLYATFEGFALHTVAKTWWEESLSQTTRVGLVGPAAFGFLRIATHPSILSHPLSADRAGGLIEEWLSRPNVVFLRPGERHMDIAIGLIRAIGTAGNLTTDVQIAASAIESGGTVCSNDSDFAKFDDLSWDNPLRR